MITSVTSRQVHHEEQKSEHGKNSSLNFTAVQDLRTPVFPDQGSEKFCKFSLTTFRKYLYRQFKLLKKKDRRDSSIF